MAFKKHARQYDLVIFGASGYTGLMTAEYIAAHFPTDLRWAVAGRSIEKLEKVAKECNALNSDRLAPEIEVCNLNDAELAALAKKTLVLIAAVGPYHRYGEYAVKACAENGTHYGEVVWHAEMIKKYGAVAKASGALMFPQSGIESAPTDLMTFSMASLIQTNLSTPVGDVVNEIHVLNAAPSGGTLATLIGLFDHYDWKAVAASHQPYAISPVPNSKRAPKSSFMSKLTGINLIPQLGLVTTSLAAGTNSAIVMRSWGLLQQEPALKSSAYGPNFTYREYWKARNHLGAMARHFSTIVGGLLLTFCPPFRSLLSKFVYQPGEGPSREDSAKDYVELRGVATPDAEDQTGKQAICRTWFSGSLYHLTALLLCEGARTILELDTGLIGGIYTPACLGQSYIDRLDAAGYRFETKIIDV